MLRPESATRRRDTSVETQTPATGSNVKRRLSHYAPAGATSPVYDRVMARRTDRTMHEVDVIVIGAGAAAIAAAHRLAPRCSVKVLEARDRAGGRAWTVDHSGVPLDLGCGWLHSADENEWAEVATML